MNITRLALDAMGGDSAPEIVIKGADAAKAKNPSLEFVFVGDAAQIKPFLSRSNNLKNASIVQADDKVDPTRMLVRQCARVKTHLCGKP